MRPWRWFGTAFFFLLLLAALLQSWALNPVPLPAHRVPRANWQLMRRYCCTSALCSAHHERWVPLESPALEYNWSEGQRP